MFIWISDEVFADVWAGGGGRGRGGGGGAGCHTAPRYSARYGRPVSYICYTQQLLWMVRRVTGHDPRPSACYLPCVEPGGGAGRDGGGAGRGGGAGPCGLCMPVYVAS